MEKDESEIFKTQNNFLIVGKKGSAKTCLGFVLLQIINQVSNRNAHIYRFPKPELLKKLPFKVQNITNMDQLFQLTDAVVLIDESHVHFSVIEKKINEELRNILSVSRSNNVCFIFICHNSFFINRGLFSFIDVRIIKEVNPNHWSLERSHMQKLYDQVHVFGKENFFIDSDYIREMESFEKPEWFTEDISNAYRIETKKEDFFSKWLGK